MFDTDFADYFSIKLCLHPLTLFAYAQREIVR